MADTTAVYAVVDKSKKKNRGTAPPVPTKNEVFESEYSMVSLDIMYTASNIPPTGAAQNHVSTQQVSHCMNQVSEQEAVPAKNEVFESEYSMVSLDNMDTAANQNVPPKATVNGTQRQSRNTPEKILKQESPNSGTNRKIFVALFITIAVVAIVLLICIAVLFAEVAKLKQTATLQQILLDQPSLNDSNILLQLQQLNTTVTSIVQQSPLKRPALNDSNTLFQLQQLNKTLHSSIKLLHATLENNTQQLNQILESGLNELSIETQLVRTELSQGITSIAALSSCAAVLDIFPSSPSGYYWVRASNGSAVRVYCDMTLSCGNITGGWMKVAELDFNNTSIMCPSSLSPLQEMNTRTCRIASSGAGCASVLFSTGGVTYNQVCGKVLAYQVNTPDAFGAVTAARNSTIDGNYVDGVSLTHGTGPRQHIWTFAAALDEYGGSNLDRAISQCSTKTHTGRPYPEFVGQDYFCDSGIAGKHQSNFPGLLTTSPLWDGAGCGSNSTCCTFNNPPWFHKQLPSPTSDDIEMRVCRDQGRGDEDIAISSVQIYIR